MRRDCVALQPFLFLIENLGSRRLNPRNFLREYADILLVSGQLIIK